MSGIDGGLGRAPYGPTGGPAYQYPTGGQSGPTGGQPRPIDRRPGPDPAKLIGLAVAGLGGLNFIWGFLPELTAPRIDENLSVFAVGPGYVPILLLIAGLLALAALLPGSERSRLAVAAVSVGGAAGAIVSLGMAGPVELLATGQVSKGLGAILLVIFGIIQAVVAIGGYALGADFSGRATVNAAASAVTGPIATVQPGWFGQPAAGAPTGFRQPAPMPYPDESVTGPQVVIGTEARSAETSSAETSSAETSSAETRSAETRLGKTGFDVADAPGQHPPDARIETQSPTVAVGPGDVGERGEPDQPAPTDHRHH